MKCEGQLERLSIHQIVDILKAMLKLLPIGAALATIISAQVPEILPSAVKTTEHRSSTAAMFATQPTHAINLPHTIAQTRYRTPQQSDDSGQVGTLVVLGAIGATAAVAVASSTKNKSFSLGVVPEDERVIVSTNRGEPLVLSETASLAGTAFDHIARRLEGEKVDFLDLEPTQDNFFARLRKLLFSII